MGVELNKANELLKSYSEKVVKQALKITSEKDSQGGVKVAKSAYFRGTLKVIKPSVENSKKLHDVHMRTSKDELLELREKVEKDKYVQEKILAINAFLKTQELTEFQKLKNHYINEHLLCLPEFQNPNNWIDRICMSPAHLENWIYHVEDYQNN